MAAAEKSMTKRWLSSSCRTGPGIELSGQTSKSGRDVGAERGLAQAGELIESLLGKLGAEFLFARNVGLHQRDVKGFRRPLNLERTETEAHHANDRRHRERQIVMRPHRSHLSFQDEPAHRGQQNDIGESDQEGEPGDAGKFRDLNHGQLRVQGGAQRVPTPAGKDHAAQPFLRDPDAARRKARRRLFVELSQGDRLRGDSLAGWPAASSSRGPAVLPATRRPLASAVVTMGATNRRSNSRARSKSPCKRRPGTSRER